MIWNISEEAYDYQLFADQVLEYKFPGHPAPPLGLLFKICTSIESWLDADEKNVAVIHCLTGKGMYFCMRVCVCVCMNVTLSLILTFSSHRLLSVDRYFTFFPHNTLFIISCSLFQSTVYIL